MKNKKSNIGYFGICHILKDTIKMEIIERDGRKYTVVGGDTLTQMKPNHNYIIKDVMSCVGLWVTREDDMGNVVDGIGFHFVNVDSAGEIVACCKGRFTLKGKAVLSDITKYIYGARKSKHVLIKCIVGPLDKTKDQRDSAKLRDDLKAFFERKEKRREKLRKRKGLKSKAAVKEIRFESESRSEDKFGFRLQTSHTLAKTVRKPSKTESPTEKKRTYTDMREVRTDECVCQSSYRKKLFHIDYGRETQEAGEPESE